MKENMVKEAYNALSISNRDSFENYASVESVSLKTDQYTFDLWLYMAKDSSDVISQENGIRIGIENDSLCFFHPSAGQKRVRPAAPMPGKMQWFNLLVSYDGSKAAFALNGVPAGEVACTGAGLTENVPIRLGYRFQGYLRSFRCYDGVLAPQSYKAYLFETVYDSKSMTALRAFMDFTQEDMPDISGHGAKAMLHGSCGVMNLVPVYRPSKGKYASVNMGDDINPGGFDSNEFSIYVKAYLRPSAKECQVVVSNGNFGEPDCVILYTQKSGEMVQLYLQMGAESVPLGQLLAAFQWVDVLVAYGCGGVSCYINGAAVSADVAFAKRCQKGEFRVGNGFDRNRPSADFTCGHYLFTAAVFDKKLEQADGDSFLQNHPYIFEDGLTALFSFSPAATELVTCRQIHLDEDDVILAQRTLDSLPGMAYDYRVNRPAPATSDMRKWKAESIWDGLVSYYETFAGLRPNLQERQKQAVIQFIASDQELLQTFAPLFITSTLSGGIFAQCMAKAPAEKMGGLLRMGRFLGGRTAAAAGGAGGGAGAAAASAGLTLSSGAAAGLAEIGKELLMLAAFTFFFLQSLNLAIQAIKKKRKEKPDDDDADVSLSFSSMSFQHTPDDFASSAVRCRNSRGSVEAPEWTAARRDEAAAVYIADKLQDVKVKFRFTITDKSKRPKPPYNVSVWAFATDSRAIFQKLEYSANGLSAGIEYEGTFTVTRSAVSCHEIVHQKLELWWNYTINGDTDTMANTRASVYLLPTTPTEPVYLDREHKDCSVPLELLRIFSKEFSAVETQRQAQAVTATAADLKFYTDQVYDCPAFRYDPSAHPYVTVCDVRESTPPHTLRGYVDLFDQNAMLNEIRLHQENPFRPKAEANCNVYACMLSYQFAFHGIFSLICIITSGVPQTALQTKPVKGAGAAAAQQFQFRYHAIVKVPPQAGVQGLLQDAYYDACCKPVSGETLANLAFRSEYRTPLVQASEAATYRGKVFRQGTAAVETRNMLFVPYGMITP